MPLATDKPRILSPDTLWVGGASVLAGLSGLLVIVWLTGQLNEADFADFMVFWSMLFWFFAALNGVQFEAVRTVTVGTTGTPNGPRVIPFMVLVSAVMVMIVCGTSPFWADRVFAHHPWPSVAIVGVGACLFAGYAAFVGVLGGLQRWRTAAVLQVVDTLIRSVPFFIIPLVFDGSLPYRFAAAAGGLSFIVALLWPSIRQCLAARGESRSWTLLSATLKAIAANAASGAFLVGYPTLMGLVLDDSEILGAAGLIFGISVTRAPLLMPITAFQSMFVSHFVRATGHRRRTALRLLGIVGGGGIVLSLALALIGPWLLGPLRPAYRLSGIALAGLTLGATAIGLAFVTGTLSIALGHHTAYVSGWIGAIAVSVVTLSLPLEVTTKVVASLIAGPLFGAAVHLVTLTRGGARPLPIAREAEGPTSGATSG